MKKLKIEKANVNYAEPNWSHTWSTIKCRADWHDANVYIFPNNPETGKGILAYSEEQACLVLGLLKVKAYEDNQPTNTETQVDLSLYA